MKKRLLTILFSLMVFLALSGIVVSAEDVDTPPEDNTPEEEMVVGVIRPLAISVSPKNLALKRGQAYRLTATPISVFQGSTYSWSSSNTSVAVVTSDGVVRGVSAGTATITVQIDIPYGNYIFYDTCSVTVASEGIFVTDTYYFCNDSSNRYAYGPTNPGSTSMVYTYDLTGAMNYRWLLVLGSDGYYTIRSLASSKYLSIQANNQVSGSYDICLTTSANNNSKWSAIMDNGEYTFVANVSGTSPVYLTEIHSGNTTYLGTSHTKNALSTWQVIRSISTSGCELPVGNYDTEWAGRFSSYQYALNFNVNPSSQNGNAYITVGGIIGNGVLEDENDIDIIFGAIYDDISSMTSIWGTDEFIFNQIDKYDDCTEGTYKIALRVGRDGNTWFRQDPDGLWSYLLYNSLGNYAFLETRDDNNQKIIDPELASFDYLESITFFFEVTPINLICEIE